VIAQRRPQHFACVGQARQRDQSNVHHRPLRGAGPCGHDAHCHFKWNSAGEHNSSLWTIAFDNERPVGALLLAPSPSTDSTEVIYLGLVPDARGRGLGSALLAHGMALAVQRPEPNIGLAVDARNSPALALYTHAGFCALRRREAFVAHPAPYAISSTPVK